MLSELIVQVTREQIVHMEVLKPSVLEKNRFKMVDTREIMAQDLEFTQMEQQDLQVQEDQLDNQLCSALMQQRGVTEIQDL